MYLFEFRFVFNFVGGGVVLCFFSYVCFVNECFSRLMLLLLSSSLLFGGWGGVDVVDYVFWRMGMALLLLLLFFIRCMLFYCRISAKT